MRQPILLAAVLSIILAAGTSRAADADEEQQYPLGKASLVLSSKAVNFSGQWSAAEAKLPNPVFDGATLRIVGGVGEGDSGILRLPGGNWTSKKNGYVYKDPKGRVGGIKMVQLARKKQSVGEVKIIGRNGWPFAVTGPQSVVTVTLTSGTAKWCAEFSAPSTNKKNVVKAKTKSAPTTCPCETYATTWAAIQGSVFARSGCTNSGCHATALPQGGLDLTPDNAYRNLVGVSAYGGNIKRVEPFAAQESFLWQKLAAGRGEFDLGGAGSPMPSGLPPISEDELRAIRLWIQHGAPEDGVVPETENLLGSCLPAAEPLPDVALDPPAATEGVQFFAPPWEIPKRKEGENGENEVCYSTYYNLAGQVPDQFVFDCPPGVLDGPSNPSKKCFSYDQQLLRQSANSHHSIIHIYNGDYPANDPGWKYECSGGTVPDGTVCDPTLPGVAAPAGADCGGGYCRGKVIKSVACTFGYGPADFLGGVGGNGSNVAPSFSGSQQPQFERTNPEGAFSILPIEGTIVWNSHAFNVYDEPTINQQWLNLWFTSDRKFPVRGIFDSDDIFIQRVQPFTEVEYCRTAQFAKGTRIADLSSHTHKRGRLFRVWGPGVAQPCNSTTNNPGQCLPEASAPIMVTTEYNDPAQLVFKTPLALDSDDPASRRFKFCSIFDNGYTDPATVKRNSTSPSVLVGGKCLVRNPTTNAIIVDRGISCLDGPKKGQPCQGNDRVCDSAPGVEDGQCDACPLRGGVSTEDEMFILIGSHYCDTSVPGQTCQQGLCAGGPNRGAPCDQCPGTPCVPYGNF